MRLKLRIDGGWKNQGGNIARVIGNSSEVSKHLFSENFRVISHLLDPVFMYLTLESRSIVAIDCI